MKFDYKKKGLQSSQKLLCKRQYKEEEKNSKMNDNNDNDNEISNI